MLRSECRHPYCQAQPQSQLSWAELALILFPPAPGRPPVRTSSEIAGNERNLLSSICRSTLVELKFGFEKLKRWKTTSMEDDLNGRRPQWNTTSMENNLNGRRPQWKTTSMEDELNGRQSQ